jgi:hypothetical protein
MQPPEAEERSKLEAATKQRVVEWSHELCKSVHETQLGIQNPSTATQSRDNGYRRPFHQIIAK